MPVAKAIIQEERNSAQDRESNDSFHFLVAAFTCFDFWKARWSIAIRFVLKWFSGPADQSGGLLSFTDGGPPILPQGFRSPFYNSCN